MRDTFRILTLAAATGALLTIGVPASAGGGGGCHQGITSDEAMGEDEATVEMVDACFTPTTLQVDPGTQVTFVSRDVGIAHNVGGNLWGHFEDMHEGDAFRVSFEEPGTYPYACSYHMGMTGAVIVGDGTGAGNGELVSVQPFEPPDPIVTTRTVAADGSGNGWIAAGAIGVLIGVAAGIGVGRARRSAQAT